ncbi:MAG: DUF4492 domain-containing protein [Bacteroidaceae bacterium]|nr:DUF4492 domain-containing protein [Bacteroidaceae bacterium]
MKSRIISIWNFYVEGFRNMTWGRTLWWLILLKVIVLFAVLRAFFFQPVLSGKTDEQKMEHVGMQLIQKKITLNELIVW